MRPAFTHNLNAQLGAFSHSAASCERAIIKPVVVKLFKAKYSAFMSHCNKLRTCLQRRIPLCRQLFSCTRHRHFSSLTNAQFPVIDISTFLSSAPSDRTASKHDALIKELQTISSQVGFFYLSGFNNLLSEQLLFFESDMSDKMQIHVSTTQCLRGFVAHGEQGYYGLDDTDKRHDSEDTDYSKQVPDAKEVFTMGTALDPSHRHFHPLLFGRNIFPDISALPQFEPTLSAYYDAMLALSNDLFHLFAVALRRNYDFFDGDICEGMNSMNCLHYMASEELEQLGIGEHTDYECFTLLAQDARSPSGLEVLMDGGQWRRFPPIENTLACPTWRSLRRANASAHGALRSS